MYARKTVKNNYRKNDDFCADITLEAANSSGSESGVGANSQTPPIAKLPEDFDDRSNSNTHWWSQPNSSLRNGSLASAPPTFGVVVPGWDRRSPTTGGVWSQPNSKGSFATEGVCKNYPPKDGFSTHRNKYSSTNNCNNCGKPGHLFHQCKMPITSIGIIAFRIRKTSNDESIIEYLSIRRKDTLGYIDFMRGKYSINNKDYIMNMLKQMTRDEKERLCSHDFNKLWCDIWGNSKYSSQYKSEEIISREKYNMLTKGICNETAELSDAKETPGHNKKTELGDFSKESATYGSGILVASPQQPPFGCEQISPTRPTTLSLLKNTPDTDNEYTLQSLIKESEQYDTWEEPEWGFPKGRRNNQENDFDCALREFTEETGYNSNTLTYIQNVLPFEEIFLGSNYKSYKHKYFLMYMDYVTTLDMGNYQTSEVSKIEWKSYDDCIACFRPYNLEKIRILTNIHRGIVSRHIIPS